MSDQIANQPVDRTGWSAGPWDDEPDRLEWYSRGYPCLARRNMFGAWCGYAAVSPGHPWLKPDFDPDAIEVHGGVTYTSKCHGDICHTPRTGESDDVTWFGFDCAHGGMDVIPSHTRFFPSLDGTVPAGNTPVGRYGFGPEKYRTLEYVKAEVEKLVDQAVAAGEVG